MKKYLTPSIDFNRVYVSDVLNVSFANTEFDNGNDNTKGDIF